MSTNKNDSWCPMKLSGTMRCEGPDKQLLIENERLRNLCKSMRYAFDEGYDDLYLKALDETMANLGFD